MPYIGHSPTNAGRFYILDSLTMSSSTNYTMQVGGVDVTPNVDNLLITLDGVIQHAASAYTVSGSTLTFDSAPGSGVEFYGVVMGQSSSFGEGSIGADELKVTGDGSSGQVLASDGDGTFTWTTDTENYLPLAGGTMSGAINLGSQNVTNGGTITGTFVGNITGNVTGNTSGTAATVTTAAQTAITSVGTLTSLTSSGGISGTTGTFSGTLLADIGAGQNTTKRALEVTEGATANMSMVGYDTVLIQANDAPTIRLYDAGSGQTHSSGTICQDENYMNIATSNELRFSTGLENSEAGYGGGDRQLTISPTSATFAGGVVETGGALKENILTNSGFSVWSNSTLINPTTGAAPVCDDAGDLFENGDAGEALTTGWTDVSGSGSQVVIASGVFDFDGNTAYGNLSSDAVSIVKGKLYRIGWDVTAVSNANDELYIGTSAGGYQVVNLSSYFVPTGVASGKYVIWEADRTASVYVTFRTGYSTLALDNLMMHEVTPGCIAANSLACDGWMKESTTDVSREHDGTYTKDGSFYSLKVKAGSANDYVIWTMNANTNTWAIGDPRLHRFDGRTVTMGVWAWTATASTARIQLQDAGGTNGTSTYSSYHTGGSGWEWLEITKTFNVDAGERYIYLRAEASGSTIYYSQPMLVFGSSIGEGNYTRPINEVVQCDKSISVFSAATISADTDFNLESQSSGMIPKGTQALYMRGHQEPTAAGNYFGITAYGNWQYLTYSPTSGTNTFNARVNVEQDGTAPQIRLERNNTFTNVYMDAQAVVLY